MEMKSLTWSSEPGLLLRGIGIDIEDPRRFEAFEPSETPLPFVFSPKELAAAATAACRAEYLCSIFVIKEALRKALGGPYDYAACDVTVSEGGASLRLGRWATEHAITSVRVHLDPGSKRGQEIVAEVFLFTPGETAA